MVVLGGDLVGADEPLIAGLREVVYQRSTALATRTLRIEPSRLGEQAGLKGCAAMVLDNILSLKPSTASASSRRATGPHGAARHSGSLRNADLN